jgi:hypothetical protein
LKKILQQVFLRDVEDLDLQLRAGLAVLHQILQAAPRPLELLEIGVMHHLVQLRGDERIDLCDARIDHRLGIGIDRDRALQHLGHEVLDEIFAALLRRRVPAQATFLDDLVEKVELGREPRRSLILCLSLSHCRLLRFPFAASSSRPRR